MSQLRHSLGLPPEQVLQEGSQEGQTEPDKNLPELILQDKHSLEEPPAQVLQEVSHDVQDVPERYFPF